MSLRSILDGPIADNALRRTLELRLLETAARFLFINSIPLPFVVVGLAIVLSFWDPVATLAAWAAVSATIWIVFCTLLYRFQHDRDRAKRMKQWRIALGAALFVAASTLASVPLLFWVQHDRANNVLLYVVVAAGLTISAGQSAPSRFLSIANIAPYCIVSFLLPLLYEPFPLNFGFSALELILVGLTVMFAQTVRGLAYEMLHLREEKRALIRRLEAALHDATAARKRAETASRAKSQFLANMSHELRTPLNAVLGFSEVIRDRLFGDTDIARYSEYAANIHASGHHLLGLINDVLDLSKIEAGKLELAPERFDLAHDMGEVLYLVEPQAAHKNIRLVCNVPKELEVFADKRALRQIAVNLLANAVKFTPPGGTVTLNLRKDAKGDVALSVGDTGIGIRPEDMERVLDTFGQGRHDIAPSDEHGTGLGLAIAKSLIEAHGGRIGIESEVAEGTTVTVVLPREAQGAVQAA